MTFEPLWLHTRLHREPAVDVFVAAGSEESVFATGPGGFPEGLCISLARTDDPAPVLPVGTLAAGAISLAAFALALDAGRARVWLSALDEIREIDNRVDAEGALREVAVRLAERVSVWRGGADGFRRSRELVLRSVDPGFARVLEAWPATAPASGSCSFPGLSEARNRSMAPPDEEHWNSWRAREVTEILGERGGLARLIGERYEPRAGQLDMALAVAKCVERDEHLMCEAGTGIGKSIAYLVPALLHGARSEQRVVVSTYTHTLQAQLIEHDLPLLQRLGYPGQARRLLGRNNYLCRRQLMRAMAVRPADPAAARMQFALAAWSNSSAEGQREELVEHPWFITAWKSHFASIEPCSPHICQRDPLCFVVRARRLAREAQVVVVNHALLMMDVRGEQSLIGPADVLVVDEAHQLPEVATHALSIRLGPNSVRPHQNLAGDRAQPGALRAVFAHLARGEDGETATVARAADEALEVFGRSFEAWLGALSSYFRERLGSHAGRPGLHRFHDAGETFGPVAAESEAVLAAASRFAAALATLLGISGAVEGEADPRLDAEREGLANLLEYHDELARQIRFVQAVEDEDYVYWIDWGGDSGLRAVVAAPLSVSAPLASAWDDHYRSVLMTSATLAVESDFLPFAESVGMDRVQRFTETLLIESPFEADRQSLLLTALNLPDPDDAHFPDLVTNVVAAISRSVVTKSLVLSTSYRLIDQLEPRLKELMAGTDQELFSRGRSVQPVVLAQRPGASREALIERFRAAPAAILLATGSFWEGVDFPGDQLELLVVPRLPFPVPTDPIIQGRTERARNMGRDAFEAVSLVDAVLRLKQGVGRLLRTRDDRGVVLLLDQRLQTRSYGVRFLNSLPRLVRILPEYADMVPETVEFLREGKDGRGRGG